MILKIMPNSKYKKVILFLKKKLYQYNLIKTNKVSNPVRWGVIGLGNMAEVMSTVINFNQDSIVYAVASRSNRKAVAFANRHGKCKAYSSYIELINDKSLNLDVIYISTPLHIHYEIIKKCLLSNKNVLCEKPITTDANQFKELVKLAKSRDCFLMEAMWMNCLPTFKKSIELLSNNKLGRIQLVRCDFYKKEFINKNLNIFKKENFGGVLQDYGVYAISFLVTFFGKTTNNFNFLKIISKNKIDTDWQITDEKNDMKLIVNLSSNFKSNSVASVICENGTVEWESQFNRTNTINVYDKNNIKTNSFKFNYKFDGFEYQVAEVVRCIKNNLKESDLVSHDHTMNVLKIIDQLKK